MKNLSRQYYEEFEEKLSEDMVDIDYHARQAERSKRIYELTKNRRGVYKVINAWAKKHNEYHYSKGIKLALSDLKKCLQEIDRLENHIKRMEES